MKNYKLQIEPTNTLTDILAKAIIIASGLSGFEKVEFKFKDNTYLVKTGPGVDNLELYIMCGNSIDRVCETAKKMAQTIAFRASKFKCVEFGFNGLTVLINANTNLDHMQRDYHTSWTTGWKTIGPDPVEEYSPELLAEIEAKNIEAAIEADKENQLREAEEAKEKEAFEAKIKGFEFDLIDKKGWEEGKANNTDGYGAAIFEYAEAWAKLMQAEMASGVALKDCYSKTSFELGFLGITGFMYGAAVNILSQCWKHGEELRKLHNKEYGVAEDVKGVVNPAVLSIPVKD